MHSFYTILILFLSLANCFATQEPLADTYWQLFNTIPPANDDIVQAGLAGAYTGISNDALIIAGGANFPNGPAWEGGEKVYHSKIYILEKEEEKYQWYIDKSFHIPQALAYGITIETENGLLCLGGNDANSSTDKVILLSWNSKDKEIEISDFPNLPYPLTKFNGGKIGNNIYVAGSNSSNGKKHFWTLDLSTTVPFWQELPTWEGAARTHALGLVQHNGEEECFYLIKGRFKSENDSTSTLLLDSWVYIPSKNKWQLADDGKQSNFFSAAGTGISQGANHIILFGGDDGRMFNVLENYNYQIENEIDSSIRENLINKRDDLMKEHRGFSKGIWAFHTITKTWSQIGTMPQSSQVTTKAIKWNDKILIPSGEISPCIRTAEIREVEISSKVRFGKLNYAIVGIYLLLLIGLGIYLAKNQGGTEDFFKAGQRIPAWAAGISIFGTQLSAITFMAIPAKTFATNWLYFFLMMTIIMVMPFIIKYFLPFYRRFNLTTAYEYLELRFNLIVRLLWSSMYLLLQIGRT
jgi:cyclically-permuted mutarotase family protein